MRHILFPTNFSEAAHHAWKYAILLAEAFDAQLTPVHVLQSLLDPDAFTRTTLVYGRDEAEQQMKEMTGKVPARLHCQYRLEEGIATEAINRLADELGIDWIVLGTAGAGTSPEVVATSHAADLIAKTRHPVLVVPSHTPIEPPRRVVLALDNEPLADSQVLGPMIEITRRFHAETWLLRVTAQAPSEEAWSTTERERLERLFAPVPISLHSTIDAHVDEGITQFARAQKAQLATVIGRKRGFLASLFHDSVAQKVALYTHVPLLVLVDEK
jgi:nucleotide-binding universal stress UspA family protein